MTADTDGKNFTVASGSTRSGERAGGRLESQRPARRRADATWRRLALAFVGALTAEGCAYQESFGPTATATAAQDLSCPADGLQVERAESWAFRATGCGRMGWYRCHVHRYTVCCRPAEEHEARAVFAPHRYPGHHTGKGQVCERWLGTRGSIAGTHALAVPARAACSPGPSAAREPGARHQSPGIP